MPTHRPQTSVTTSEHDTQSPLSRGVDRATHNMEVGWPPYPRVPILAVSTQYDPYIVQVNTGTPRGQQQQHMEASLGTRDSTGSTGGLL